MLESFDIIRNVGRYESVTNTPNFGKLTLVYSENGRGKTTLCAVLRSLATGCVDAVLERKRLSSNGSVAIVANIDGEKFAFSPSKWNKDYSKPVIIFDERFVNDNIFSGLSVASGQRKNLHELVLGEQGVTFQKKVVELTDEISQLHSVLRERERTLSSDIRGGLSFDEFCDIQIDTSIDDAIESAQSAVNVIESSSTVASTRDFEVVEFPVIDRESIQAILASSLSSIHQDSVEAVKSHFAILGKTAESWIERGQTLLALSSPEDCPFCGESLENSDLFTHYEAYFSDAYKEHLSTIQSKRNEFAKSLSGDSLADLVGRLGDQKSRYLIWEKHIELSEMSIDVSVMETAWKRVRKSVSELFDAKLADPLGEQTIPEAAIGELEDLEHLAEKLNLFSKELVSNNEQIKQLKEQAEHGNLANAKKELKRLETIKRRFEPETIALCLQYVKAKADKLAAEARKEKAKEDLNLYRETSFPKCQTEVNKFLVRFNADFSLESFKAVDPKGQPSSSYALTVNQKSVPISSPDNEPCFGTTLSTGDRNTLALAFFFASLESQQNLADATIIIDDPASSLDDGRTVATAQEIKKLTQRTEQVIVLSHSKRLLCEIWGNGNHPNWESLKIRNAAVDSSTIEQWNVSDASISDYDRRHEAIRKYAEDNIGQPKEVAMELRPALEGYLRTACVENFPPGTMLGEFTGHAKNMESNGNPIIAQTELVELDELREYTNRFHHENPSWQTELANINETELRGFARRVLAFTRAMRRIGVA